MPWSSVSIITSHHTVNDITAPLFIITVIHKLNWKTIPQRGCNPLRMSFFWFFFWTRKKMNKEEYHSKGRRIPFRCWTQFSIPQKKPFSQMVFKKYRILKQQLHNRKTNHITYTLSIVTAHRYYPKPYSSLTGGSFSLTGGSTSLTGSPTLLTGGPTSLTAGSTSLTGRLPVL